MVETQFVKYLPVKEPHYIFCMFTGRLVRCKLNILAGIYFSCLGRFLHLHAGIFDEIPTVLNVDGNRWNGHVTDDVTWPRKVKVMTPIYLGPIISTIVGDTDLVPMEHL